MCCMSVYFIFSFLFFNSWPNFNPTITQQNYYLLTYSAVMQSLFVCCQFCSFCSSIYVEAKQMVLRRRFGWCQDMCGSATHSLIQLHCHTWLPIYVSIITSSHLTPTPLSFFHSHVHTFPPSLLSQPCLLMGQCRSVEEALPQCTHVGACVHDRHVARCYSQ